MLIVLHYRIQSKSYLFFKTTKSVYLELDNMPGDGFMKAIQAKLKGGGQPVYLPYMKSLSFFVKHGEPKQDIFCENLFEYAVARDRARYPVLEILYRDNSGLFEVPMPF